jgi:hypothetical protein
LPTRGNKGRQKDYERRIRAEAKAMGMTYLQYREHRRSQNLGKRTKPTGKRNRNTTGVSIPSIREVHDQLLAETEFIQDLKTLQDTGRSRPRCRSCNRQSDFDDYFCIHCGEHADWLYCEEHAQAPITLTREQIMTEYAAADRPFHGQNYDAGTLRMQTIQDLTGVNPYATFTESPHKEENRWKGLTGFQTQASSPTT